MEIRLQKLTKTYKNGKTKALNDINLNISNGIFGLLGENGAGKTTLLKILATMIPHVSGSAKIGEYDLLTEPEAVRKIIGYLPQNFDFFGTLTVWEAMEYSALLKMSETKCQRDVEIERLICELHLLPVKNKKVNQLSGGTKQRLGIAISLIGKPSILILDEPTVGLDPSERLRFRNIISQVAVNKIVILSSHIISDISMLCPNLALMKDGEILYSGSTTDLVRSMNGKVFIQTIMDNQPIPESIYPKVISVVRQAEGTEIRFYSDNNIDSRVIPALPTLEDAYFYKMHQSVIGDNE